MTIKMKNPGLPNCSDSRDKFLSMYSRVLGFIAQPFNCRYSKSYNCNNRRSNNSYAPYGTTNKTQKKYLLNTSLPLSNYIHFLAVLAQKPALYGRTMDIAPFRLNHFSAKIATCVIIILYCYWFGF